MTDATARGALRRGDSGRRRGGLREPGHARVPARSPGQLLLHRDQLPHPGRASRDGDALGHGPRHRADPHRLRRATGLHAGQHHAARPRDRVPHQRRGHAHDFRPQAGIVERYLPPGGPGVRMDSHLYRATRSRPTTIRCSASSSSGAPTATRRLPARATRSTRSSSTAGHQPAAPPGAARPRDVPERTNSRPTCSIESAAPRSSTPRPLPDAIASARRHF